MTNPTTTARRRSRRLASALLAAVVAVSGACADGDEAPDAGTAPSASPTSAAAADAAEPVAGDIAGGRPVDRREVRFRADDGTELAGLVFGDGSVGVVLAHMRGRDKSTWFDFAERAAAEGYRVLAFDFRGYGDSAGVRDTALATDLSAAVELLRVDGVDRTVVIGASMGATAAVYLASQVDLAGVVALSPPGNFNGLEAEAQAPNVGEPMLVVAAADDHPYIDAARTIAETGLAATLLELPGNLHGTAMFTDHGPELTRALLAFLADR